MWPQLYDGRRAGWCFITFTVGADKCGKVWDQGNGWEVSDVCDLQRPQQRAQPLCTKSGSGLNTHLSWGEYVALVLNNDHQYFQYGTAEETDWSVTHLRGLRINADLLKDVFEELRGTLLNHMMDSQTCLQVLQEALHKAHEVLCSADAARHSLCRESRMWQIYLDTWYLKKCSYLKLNSHKRSLLGFIL